MEVTLDTWATACRDAARTVGLPDLTGLDPAGEGDGRNQGTDAGLVRAAERCLALSNLAAWALDGRRATMAEDAIVARGEDATPETLAAEAARQARHAATVTLGTGLSEIEVTQARAREGLERLADTVREGVQRREAPVAGHEDERARCQEAIMQGGTLYDMERELLLESYTTDDGPTVEAFAVTPSELEEARKAWGSEAGSFEAEPGTHLLTYSLDDMRDRAALVDLMAAEAPRMAKGLVSDSETLGGLTDDVRTFEAQQKIRRDVESIADPEVSEDRVAGVLETLDSEDFYSSEAGLLVVSYMMAGNTPRDVEVWKVSPPVLSDALARLDARRGPDELMPTLADTTDLLPDQPIVIDSSDTRELRQLAQAIASPANGFVAGGEWESQSRSERTGAFRADEAGRAALASAVEAAEPPQDLEAATRAVAASGDLVSPTRWTYASVHLDHNGDDVCDLYPGADVEALAQMALLAEDDAAEAGDEAPDEVWMLVDTPLTVIGSPVASIVLDGSERAGRLVGFLTDPANGFVEMPVWTRGEGLAVAEGLFSRDGGREDAGSGVRGTEASVPAQAEPTRAARPSSRDEGR